MNCPYCGEESSDMFSDSFECLCEEQREQLKKPTMENMMLRKQPRLKNVSLGGAMVVPYDSKQEHIYSILFK